MIDKTGSKGFGPVWKDRKSHFKNTSITRFTPLNQYCL